MPIDPSIALQVRPPQFDNPLATYSQMLQVQQAQNQNALAQYQLSRAQREDETQNAMSAAYRAPGVVGPDGSINRAELVKIAANGPAARELPKLLKALDTMDADRVKMLKESLSISGGALATIAQNPTRENAVRVASELVRVGLPGADKMLSSIPQNDAEVAQWVRLHAGTTEHTLKVLQAYQPKIEYKDAGGMLQPVQENALAGALGPTTAAPAIAKTMTPEGIANRDVQIRGQNMADARSREQMTFQREKDSREKVNAPSGYRWKDVPGGELEPIPGGPATKDKALTEAQGKATGFSIRAREAADLLNGLEKGGTFGRVSSKVQATREALDRVPVVGTALANVAEGAGNSVVSGDQQKYDQAKRDFINAVLRVESGATITVPEFLNADRQYFPQAGDGQAVIEQKRKNREKAIQALMAQTGPGGEKVPASRTIEAAGGWKIQRVD